MDNNLGNTSLNTDAIADQAWYNCFIVIDFRVQVFAGETEMDIRFHSSVRV
jgi:hypothetical protein